MKKIINKYSVLYSVAFMAVSVFAISCGGNKKEAELKAKAVADSLSRPENIKIVAAIAKVEPVAGLVSLSADVSGIIAEVYKNEGDSIKKGDLILKLDQKNENLQLEQAKQDLITQQSKLIANEGEIRQQEASLREKEQDLAISQKLVVTGAETRQNVRVKQKEKEVIQANLQIAKAQLNASQSELKRLKNKIEQSALTLNNRLVYAQESGVLVSLDAKVGAALTAFTPYATIAPKGNLVLHGEIDEMFADRVKIGQEVDVNYVGNSQIIAKGKIMYLSPILENKSLFYEKTGESSDRRIRQFKVELTSSNNLLINAKVECKIKID